MSQKNLDLTNGPILKTLTDLSREFDSLGSPNASQSLIRLYFFCQFLILYFHVMLSYVIITMR